ncbi:glycosyltransferase family protein [Nocardioides dilutus]
MSHEAEPLPAVSPPAVSQPVVSLVLDGSKASPGEVQRTLRSLQAQTVSRWEVIVRAVERPRPADDPRIRHLAAAVQDHQDPAEPLQEMVALAGAEFVAIIDAGAELVPEAVGILAGHLRRFPDADIVYTDEVVIHSRVDGRLELRRKPAWSPEHLRGRDYTGRLCLLRTRTIADVGGFRPGFDGAHELDLLLRMIESGSVGSRVPELLHRSRVAGESGGGRGDEGPGGEGPDAARVRAVQEHLDRTGRGAIAEAGAVPGTVSISRTLPAAVTVSVVIPSEGASGLAWGDRRHYAVAAAESFLRTAGPAQVEVIVVHTDEAPAEAIGQLRELGPAVRLVPYDNEFHFAAMANRGFICSQGEFVIIADERVEAGNLDFVPQLVAPLLEEGVGLTGPRVLTAGGVHFGAGVAVYVDRVEPVLPAVIDEGARRGDLLAVNRECSALLPQCQAMSRRTFESVGGINERLETFHNADLAAKVGFLGLSTLWVRAALLRHFPVKEERDPVAQEERIRFHMRWNNPELDRYLPQYGERLMLRNERELLESEAKSGKATKPKQKKEAAERRSRALLM